MLDASSPALHDDLGLAKEDFSRTRLIVLHGRSGAGKSSAMQWLALHHPHLQAHASADDSMRRAQIKSWVLIDEVLTWRDLPVVWHQLKAARRVVVASHLDPHWFAVFRGYGPQRHFRMDPCLDKLRAAFDRMGIDCSDHALQRFAQTYGANYTDAELILEYAGHRDFDRALRQFEREGNIRHHDPAMQPLQKQTVSIGLVRELSP